MRLKMLCACRTQSSVCSPILDCEEVLQDYAWKEFRRLTPWLSSMLIRRADYTINVQWNFFEFEHCTTKFQPRPNTKDGFQEKKQVELFSTNFKNDTGVAQSYKFKIQRQTKAVTNVTFQRGFTIKGNANFKLTIPVAFGDCGVSAGVDGQLNITKSNGETFEETFTWETDNDVTVEKNHVTYAKMLLTEDELTADFEVKTTVKLPSGQAPIIIRRRRDNEIQAVTLLSNLAEVFSGDSEDHVKKIKVKNERNEVHYDIELTTTGVIQSARWRDQKICLHSHPLSTENSTAVPEMPLLDVDDVIPTDDLVDLKAKEIYAQVIKHATQSVLCDPSGEVSGVDEQITRAMEDQKTAGEERTSRKGARNQETHLLKFPTIPTIITELHPNHILPEELAACLSRSEGHIGPPVNEVIKGSKQAVKPDEEKPKLERGQHCVDGNSPPSEKPAQSLSSESPSRQLTNSPPSEKSVQSQSSESPSRKFTSSPSSPRLPSESTSPRLTVSTTQSRRAKLAKVTSV